MASIRDVIQQKPWLGWVLFLATVVVVVFGGLFALSIMERRSEEKAMFQLVKPIAQWEPRNKVWGENFPREYESYKKTSSTSFSSKHGGSVMIDFLKQYPNLVILWAGYGFSRDYNQSRGHYYAINDIRNTLRTGKGNPATCWTCKSTDVPRLMNQMGIGVFYKDKWYNLGPEVVNSIGCQDCHDSQTMKLRITRPALIEAFQRQGKDITQATHNEMRSLVCAQCHVEYYFKGKKEKYLTFPWDKGLTMEAMEEYFDAVGHVDWVHALSRTKMLKAQHPDYEIYLTGIHSERQVSCADCHMPYRREGGVKFTDHWIQSPLNNIANSCQVCHRESEITLMNNVFDRQDKVLEVRGLVEHALVKAHIEAKTAWDNGATEAEMEPIKKLIRHAQWRWDYAAASHGGAFHSPVESLRVLGSALGKAQEARLLLAHVLIKHDVSVPVPLPDITTKEKAQAYIGLDMEKLKQAKAKFLKIVVPEWDKKAEERQSKMKY
ncbi:MAG: ammonia-forming cytochrome c nitrite reductase [Candidatus Methylomirabilales bacterium]